MHLYLTRLVLLLAPSSALLQVHTRLAKAILHKAKVDAMQQREALLAQAELLFAAAADIDDALAKLERGEAMAEPPVVTRLAPPPPEAPAETALRRLGGRVLRVVDFAGDAAATAPLDVARAVALDAVHVLAWRGGAGGADGVAVGDGLTALAVRRDDGAGVVVVALECEEHARQVAHVMTSLDGFAMEAARISLDAAADAVLARRDCALGVVLLEE